MATKSDLVPSKRFLPDVPANGGRRARLESSARVLQQGQNPRPQLEGMLREKCNSMIRAKKNLDRLRMTHEAWNDARSGDSKTRWSSARLSANHCWPTYIKK